MLEEILDQIYRIPVPLPDNPLKELNSFLIKGNGRNLLIDTGFCRKECYDALTDGLKQLNVSMEDTDILLTHLHSDHTGLAQVIAGPDTKIYLSRPDQVWLTRSDRFKNEAIENRQYYEGGFSKEDLSTISDTHPGRRFAPDPAYEAYIDIKHGDILTVGDYKLQIIRTPGHTPAHSCLWLEKEKTMFTGDHVLFDITPNITSWPNLRDALGHYLNSLRLVDSYPVERAIPSHRKTGDFHGRIAELIAHHEYRLNECFQIICQEPGLSPYDISGRMTWRIRAKNWETFPISQKWFAVGECLSHLERLCAEGKVYPVRKDDHVFYYPSTEYM